MMRSAFLFFFICLVQLGYVYAQEAKPMTDPAIFKTKLREASKQTNSIIADFTEEKYTSYMKEPQKSVGVFYYKKNNKLRWEKTSPVKYIFIADGDKVRIQDNGKEVNISSANQVVGKIKDLMLNLVNGEFDSGKLFAPAYFHTAGTYVVKLIPKNKRLKNLYDYLQVSFSKEDMLLKELAFYEKSGDKSIMTFSNSKTNQSISESVFANF